MRKEALVTGITGQDGSYLAEHLLEQGYNVTGITRSTSNETRPNLKSFSTGIKLIYADLTDSASVYWAIKKAKPDEIYNLGAFTEPGKSFDQPLVTADTTGLGTIRLLEAVRQAELLCKIYQASSSEMYGKTTQIPQNEDTPFNPKNPYAIAKISAHYNAGLYRSGYGMFVSCGILFNHESPRRGMNFVTQKVTYAAACAKLGIRTSQAKNEAGEPIFKNNKVSLGNLDAERDWGFAGDYVKAMWSMLQYDKPDDFVIATGEKHSIRELCSEAFKYVGLNYEDFVTTDQRFVRPAETGPLIGDYSKAKKLLGWEPTVKFPELVAMMVESHIARLK